MTQPTSPSETTEVSIDRTLRWSYAETGLSAQCRIDGSRGTVSVALAKIGSTFHDCLGIKSWLVSWLKDNPTTAEELLCAVSRKYPDYQIEVRWMSENHGPIIVRSEDAE